MAFNSVSYLLFLCVAVCFFWLLPVRLRRGFVLLASLLFYASWGLFFVWMPLLVAAIVYFCGKRIEKDRVTPNKWMWVGVIAVLLLLAILKYRSFALENLRLLLTPLGSHASLLVTTFAFPLGISFYTFEAIAYLMDVRQGRVKMPGFEDLCLFFFFWPNILSGPIVRARELVPQLGFRSTFEPQFLFDGFDRIIWGLVQKHVIANLLGIWVDKGFAPSAGVPSTMDGWFLAVAFGLQIYFDFAGYTNMAIGAARLLGVRLPENFRQPYHAATPPDLWGRWHMTLSRWIRDYVFFPMNAKWHGAPLPLYVSLLGVMALVGLWHGAGRTFIVWGLLHGFYLVAYRAFENWKTRQGGASESQLVVGTWRIFTLIGVAVAWVVFRSATLSKARIIVSSMLWHFSRGAAYNDVFYVFTALVVVFCALEPLILRSLNELDEQAGSSGLAPMRVLGRPMAYLFGLLLFLLFDQNNAQFIYSQF
jgi:alginate O-acetyltransferase complex protein AlgI